MFALNKGTVTIMLMCLVAIMTAALMFGMSEKWFIISLGAVAAWCAKLAMGEAR